MKNYRRLSYLFTALAVLLSDVMCAYVAYDYCSLWWGGRYEGWSAPTWVAFLYLIPFGIGIAICAALARFFRKKHQRNA